MSLNDHLAMLRKILEKMPGMTTEEIAEYADNICKENVNADWIKKQMMQDIKPGLSWNMTAAGNIAYVILHCDDEKVVKEAKKKLEAFREFISRTISRRRNENTITEKLRKR